MQISDISIISTKLVKKSFSDLLKESSWTENSTRVLVNVNDYAEEDFNDPNALSAILSRCINEEINYVSWGPSTTVAANENFITLNDNNGMHITTSAASNSYNEAITATAQYIKNLLAEKAVEKDLYVVVNTPLTFNVIPEEYLTNSITSEYPNGSWYIEHDISNTPGVSNYSAESGFYRNDLDIESFDLPGTYKIYFRDELVRSIYVHRAPEASFGLTMDGNQINYTNNSRDPDATTGTGIAEEKWSYMEAGSNAWTEGQLTTIEAGKSYVVKLEVKDAQGEWSAPTTKYVSGSVSEDLPPVSDFVFNTNIISKYNKSFTISDSSYDPKGEDITKYIWSVTKDGSPIVNQEEYTSWDTPDVDFETLGAGEYAFTLVVENSAGLTSDTYTRFLQVTEDTIKPAVSLSPANAGWTTTQHEVELIINDEDSLIDYYEYCITQDSSLPTNGWIAGDDVEDEDLVNKEIVIDSDGLNYLHIKAYDQAGNETILTRGPFRVDTTQPEVTDVDFYIPQTTPGNENIFKEDIKVTIDTQDEGTNSSGIVTVQYKTVADDGTDSGWINVEKNASDEYEFDIDYEFSGTVITRCKDVSGNWSPEFERELLVDKTSPDSSINISVSREWSNGNLDVTIESSDAHNIKSIEYTATPQDGGSAINNKTDFTDEENEQEVSFTITEDGIYDIVIEVIDAAGNSTQKTKTVKIDKTNPVINSVTINQVDEEGNPVEVNGSRFQISVDAEDALSGLSHIEYKTTSSDTWQRVEVENMDEFIIPAVFGDIEFRAIDNAGNVSDITTVTNSVVDTIAPELVVSRPGEAGSSIKFELQTNDNMSGIKQIIVTYPDAQGNTIRESYPAGTTEIIVDQEGRYDVVIEVHDNAGNITSITRPVDIDENYDNEDFEYDVPGSFPAPKVNFNNYDEGDWEDDDVIVTLSYAAGQIPAGGIKKYQYKETWDDQWFDIDATTVFDKYFDEEIVFRAVANDGNYSDLTSPYLIRVDTSAPVIDDVDLSLGNSYYQLIVEVEDRGSGVKRVKYVLNNGDMEEAEHMYDDTYCIWIPEGPFGISIWAYDKAGNKSKEYTMAKGSVDNMDIVIDSNNNIMINPNNNPVEKPIAPKPTTIPAGVYIQNGVVKGGTLNLDGFEACCLVPLMNGTIAPLAVAENGTMKFVPTVNGDYRVFRNHKTFKDVIYGWNYEAVHTLSAREIINGYPDGEFKGEKNISRAEAITMLVRLNNLPLYYSASSFKDVANNFWAMTYIEAAYRNGILNGIATKTFEPNRDITREELAIAIYNVLKLNGLAMDTTQKHTFQDSNKIPATSKAAVNAVVNIGVINGYEDNTVRIQNKITRAETAQMIWKTLQIIVNSKSNLTHLSY